MKLSKKALIAINNRTAKLTLALKLQVSERWIEKCIVVNAEGSILTETETVKTIRKLTGLNETEIIDL